MPNYFIYPIFTIIVGAAALLIIPKEQYKHYLLYGFLFGGVGQILIASLLTALNLIQYKNMGPFNILGLTSIWTPLTWALAFTIFFFLLPRRKVFLIPYVLTFAALSYSVDLVKEAFGLFEYIGFNRYTAPINFLVWYSVSAWVYIRSARVELK
ncbi:MAG: hypothetical protein Q7J85_06600 [Bacillota bacterium]|nr:hypothetical protein [Bacillota bacterium]